MNLNLASHARRRSTGPSGRFSGALLAALVLASWTAAGPAWADVDLYQSPAASAPAAYQEPPALQARVAAGELPPVTERLPQNPRVVLSTPERQVGKSGGEIRTLVGGAKDTRLLVVFGYARLLCYDENLDLVPDIAEKIEVEDGRIFTITLRKGHKWSDGEPFTTDDFRYWWEDVANNEELSPTGPPNLMLVDGAPPVFEILDEITVRYTWAQPNPYLLANLAGARPLFIYSPAHYLKRFHEKYADPAELEAKIAETQVRNWAQLHNRLDNLYRFDNPDLPTLQPWMNTTAPPSQRFIGVRNPYYHRVDEAGQQLPYLDEFRLEVVNSSLIPAKSGAGETDLQARGLSLRDYTFLKTEEERSGLEVRLWRTVRGSEYALYPNLNTVDDAWRAVFRDRRFRQALSLATDRDEINQLIYLGLGSPGNHSVLPGSPLYKPEYREAYASLEPKKANALLDEMGLTERDGAGLRKLPDGRSMEIVIETAGESSQETDILELIRDQWLKVGIKMHSKPSQREVLRNRIFAGETLMTLWFGYENGVPTPDMSPGEFAPTQQYSYQWPKWGQYYETSGGAGTAIDMPEAQELMDLFHAWTKATGEKDRKAAWSRILEIQAEEVFTIGLVAQIPQPVVVSRKLRNVPKEGIFNWDPGAQFGMYRTDSFWLDTKGG